MGNMRVIDRPDLRALTPIGEVERLQGIINRSQEECQWAEDSEGFYKTECGRAFTFSHGYGLEREREESGWGWCPYCGRKITEPNVEGQPRREAT